jgi:pyrroloquinoline quinone biosynthesis protein B
MVPHLTTCVAVIDNGRAWLLDAGPDFRQHLTRLRAEGLELAGVLLTHGHIGHYTGLMFLGREAMNTSAMPVWAAPRLADFLRTQGPWEQLVAGGNIALNVIAGDRPIPLSDRVTVTAVPVPHRDEYSETVGFRVSGPDASLLYVPDTDSWEHWEVAIETHIESVEMALLDATFFDDAEVPHRDLEEIGHPTVMDSLTRFGRLADTERAKIRFTHLNHSNPLLDPTSDATIRVLRAGMAVAVEGDTHEL